VLGLTEDTMNQGWVARFSSPEGDACVQVVTRDATAPEDAHLTIKVDDLEGAHAAMVERGYQIVHPITDEPWGIRRFFVRSPDGQVVNVAQHNHCPKPKASSGANSAPRHTPEEGQGVALGAGRR
jgi:predicted enzyme related to lactoylglutathione lyase